MGNLCNKGSDQEEDPITKIRENNGPAAQRGDVMGQPNTNPSFRPSPGHEAVQNQPLPTPPGENVT